MATNELSAGRITTSKGAEQVWHPKRGIRWGTVARHAFLIACCVGILLPLFWVVLLSLKSLPDGYQRYIWPHNFMEPLFGHYDWVLTQRRDVIVNFRNSVMVTTGTVILATITAVLAGYALVHLRTPGRKIIMAA